MAAKGQALPRNPDQGEPPKVRRRGMMPPSGEGPIEVVRDAVEEPGGEGAAFPNARNEAGQDGVANIASREGGAEPVDRLANLKKLLPSEVSSSLDLELPADTEDRRTILTACERRLYAAGMLHEALQAQARSVYFYYAGPAVRLAWSTESWRDAMDPVTEKPCRSWSAWLRLMKVSRQHAYRMTKEEPLMKALKDLGVQQLDTAQIDAMTPVLNGFGPSEVRRLWTSALGWGDTSGPSLMRIRPELGLEPMKMISEGEEPAAPPKSDLPILRFQTKAGVFDANQVRTVARAQPEIALLVARAIFAELGVDEQTEAE